MPIVTDRTRKEQEFKYYTFQVVKNNTEIVNTHTLIVNPEELSQDEGARVEITKTIAGGFIDEWGKDFTNFTIRGTTGYKKRLAPDGTETDGFQAFKDLRNNIYRYFLEPDGTLKQRRPDNDTFELRFHNWEDGEHYFIMPLKFKLNRSKGRPLLYAYDFNFVAYRPILLPMGSFTYITNIPTQSTDPVNKAVTDFDTVVKNAMENLLESIVTLDEATVNPVRGAALSPFEEKSYLTELNYPGITPLRPRVMDLKIETTKVRMKLFQYTRREENLIDMYTYELKGLSSFSKSLCRDLSTLTEVPNEVLAAARDIGKECLLLSKFSEYFKDGDVR